MFKRIFVLLLCVVSLTAYGQGITKYEYWVDFGAGKKTVAVSGNEISLNIDVSSLCNGVHFLCLRAMDANGVWSSPSTTMFLKAGSSVPNNSMTKYEYWLDYGTEKRMVTASGNEISFNLDVSSLCNGMHFLCLRAMDANGVWSSPSTTMFLKAGSSVPNNGMTKYEYWVDYGTEKRTVAASGNEISLNLDVSSLCNGMHFFCLRVMDANGVWSGTSTTMFLKLGGDAVNNGISKYEYWIDYNIENKAVVEHTAGIVSLNLDVKELTDGMHFLCLRVQDVRGQWGSPLTACFLKQSNALENNAIVGYRYWLNDDTQNVRKVSIEPQNPLMLDVGLDFENMSILPDANLLHMQFVDACGKYSEVLTDTFTYREVSSEGIDELIACNKVNVRYSEGRLLLKNVQGMSCRVYSVSGLLIAEDKELGEHSIIPVGNADIIIFQLFLPDGRKYSMALRQK